MSRFPLALSVALIANPLLMACAHDPLDDKSGEEEFNNKVEAVDAEGKPRTAKAERQEADLKKEEDDIEQVQFKFNEEKEAFIADKSDEKEVISAQHQRDLVLGHKSNTGPPTPSSGPQPKSVKSDDSDSKGSDSGSTTTATHKPKANKGGDDSKKKDDSKKDDSAAK